MQFIISGLDCYPLATLIKTIACSEIRVCQAEEFLSCAEKNHS